MNSFIQLLKGGPRNIRRRLFRDVILMLLLTGGTIIGLVFFQGYNMKEEISSTLITESTRLIKKRYIRFMEPFANNLQLMARMGESGLLSLDDIDSLDKHLKAFMDIQPQLHTVLMADSNGKEYIVSTLNGKFKSSLHEAVISDATSLYNIQQFPESTKLSEKHADPRTTLWFRGANTIQPSGTLFWTEPYTLSGTDIRGITGAIEWKTAGNDREHFVSASHVLFSDIIQFIADIDIIRKGTIVLITQHGTLLSRSAGNELGTAQNSSSTVAQDAINNGIEQWKQTDPNEKQIISYKINKKTWWAGFTPVEEQDPDTWVGVIVPEDELFQNIQQRWTRIALLAVLALVTGIIISIFILNKYSHRLKDLPQRRMTKDNFQKELQALIDAGESSSLEFKSTMRTNLKTGKNGKEIELAWLKALVGFMNSDGGILLLGVEDNGNLMGIEIDNFANEDKCRLHFKNLVSNHIGAEFFRYTQLKINSVADKTIAVIECERVRQPVFLKVGKNEDFFIRSGPSSTKLSMSQMIAYLNNR